MNSIKQSIVNIIKESLDYNVKNFDENLFDIFPAYELLYLINPIEKTFGIDIKNIILNEDHNVMSVDGISKKILELQNGKDCDD